VTVATRCGVQVKSPLARLQIQPSDDGLAAVGVVALGRVETSGLLGEGGQLLSCLTQGLDMPVEGGQVPLEQIDNMKAR
jgi:hypothetical protein